MHLVDFLRKSLQIKISAVHLNYQTNKNTEIMTIVDRKSGYKMVSYAGESASFGLMMKLINNIEENKDSAMCGDDYIIQIAYRKSFGEQSRGDFRIVFDYKSFRSSDLQIIVQTGKYECDYTIETIKIEDLTPKKIKAIHSKVARAKKLVVDAMAKNTEAWQELEASKLELIADRWDRENRGYKTMLAHLDIQITE